MHAPLFQEHTCSSKARNHFQAKKKNRWTLNNGWEERGASAFAEKAGSWEKKRPHCSDLKDMASGPYPGECQTWRRGISGDWVWWKWGVTLYRNIHLNLEEETQVNVAKKTANCKQPGPKRHCWLGEEGERKSQPSALGGMDNLYTQRQCVASGYR